MLFLSFICDQFKGFDKFMKIPSLSLKRTTLQLHQSIPSFRRTIIFGKTWNQNFQYLRIWVQKQPPEVFYKRRCYQKFFKFHCQTLVLESLFKKAAVLKECIFIRKRVQYRCFHLKFAKIFKNSYSEEHLRTTASSVSNYYPYSKVHVSQLLRKSGFYIPLAQKNPTRGHF